MNFEILSEASPAEMTEALRWISFLKPYMKQATVGKAKRYIAGLKRDLANLRNANWAKTGNPIEFLESPWFRITLFIPKDAMSHLFPRTEPVFHTDDEFDGADRNEYFIEVRPAFDPPINSDLPKPFPPLVQKYLLQTAIEFREEMKSML